MKLLAAIKSANKTGILNYDLQDVFYTTENSLKAEVLSQQNAFTRAYMDFLDELAKPLDFGKITMRSPIASLLAESLVTFLDYLMHTKNKHFGEERECRLSHIQPVATNAESLSVHYFNRGGLIVPYTKTPHSSFNILNCLEWIVIGPGPRMGDRFKAASQLVRQSGRKIGVRASHIPFTRL